MEQIRPRKDRLIVFTTTEEMEQALLALAASKDSLSSLMREIVSEYFQNHPATTPSEK
jgi:hypothetical protein